MPAPKPLPVVTIAPKEPVPQEPKSIVGDPPSPIGTGFMPESDVTIHKKKVQLTHPGGPQNVLYETVETTEVRPGRKPTTPKRTIIVRRNPNKPGMKPITRGSNQVRQGPKVQRHLVRKPPAGMHIRLPMPFPGLPMIKP